MYKLVALLLLTGCVFQKKEDKNFIELTGKKQIFANLMCPYALDFVGPYLIITDDCNENIFHIYEAGNLRKLGSFGTKGEGPNDYKFPKPTGQIFNYDGKNLISIMDTELNVLRKIDLDSALWSKDYNFNEQVEFDANLGLVKTAYILENNITIGTSRFNGLGRAFIHKNGVTKWIEYGPELAFEVPYEKKYILYGSVVGIVENKIALAMDFFRRIELYETDGNIIKQNILIDPVLKPEVTSLEYIIPDELIRYYNEIKVHEKRIYVLNYNMSYLEYYKEHLVKTSIDLFDEEINLLKTYQLDQRIMSFDIYEKEGFILGIAELTEDGEYQIFKYDINSN